MEQDAQFRHILLYYFRRRTHRRHTIINVNEALKEMQCQNWFAKCGSGDFSPKKAQRSGRPVEVYEKYIKAIIDSDRHNTIHEKLNVSHTCIKKN